MLTRLTKWVYNQTGYALRQIRGNGNINFYIYMEAVMIKVGIIGSTGYAGQEIVRILLGHKEAEIVWYGSRSFIDQKYYQV